MSINRFLEAQDLGYPGYEQALSEIKSGKKRSHWIWYIFPQVRGLGKSGFAQKYAINGLDEAREYLADDTLRSRLIEISEAVLALDGDIDSIMSAHIDAQKLRSSMTLFQLADGSIEVFGKVLDKFFSGIPDRKTIEIINGSR